MRNETINYVVEVKEGRNWKEERFVTDALEVYKSLAEDMVHKKLNECTYIRSIKRTPLYNGFCKITVSYDNDVRRIYVIED